MAQKQISGLAETTDIAQDDVFHVNKAAGNGDFKITKSSIDNFYTSESMSVQSANFSPLINTRHFATASVTATLPAVASLPIGAGITFYKTAATELTLDVEGTAGEMIRLRETVDNQYILDIDTETTLVWNGTDWRGIV